MKISFNLFKKKTKKNNLKEKVIDLILSNSELKKNERYKKTHNQVESGSRPHEVRAKRLALTLT